MIFWLVINADSNNNPLPFSYQNITNPQTIYIRVENVQNPSCYTTSSFQIAVSKQPVANSPQNLFLCDGIENDGFERFDLEPLKAQSV